MGKGDSIAAGGFLLCSAGSGFFFNSMATTNTRTPAIAPNPQSHGGEAPDGELVFVGGLGEFATVMQRVFVTVVPI